MKRHYLPSVQDQRNTRVTFSLRVLGAALGVLLAAYVVLALYVWGHKTQALLPELVDPSGTTLGEAVFVGPQSVLFAGRAPNGLQVKQRDAWQRTVVNVHVESIVPGVEVSLLRLDSPVTDVSVSPAAVQDGQKEEAGEGASHWEGVLIPSELGLFKGEPDLSIQAGSGVYLLGDRTSLIGITIQHRDGMLVAPMTNIVAKFPELGQ